ncbi:MAG: hypothetical protein ABI597_14210 [Gammaproteobacteria bacterium]
MHQFSVRQQEDDKIKNWELNFNPKTQMVSIKETVTIHQIYDNKAKDPRQPVVLDKKNPLIEGSLTHEVFLNPRGKYYEVKIRRFEPVVTICDKYVKGVLFSPVKQEQEIQLILAELIGCKIMKCWRLEVMHAT